MNKCGQSIRQNISKTNYNMKKKLAMLLTVGMLAVASGCSSTVTLGPQANKDAVVGANLSTTGVGVTLPLIKAETRVTEAKEE